MAVAFRVLGEIGVSIDGQECHLRPMERIVLAIMLATPNRSVSAELLVDRVWRGAPPRTAGTAVRVHVDRLRTAMRRREVSRLLSVTGGYRLIVEPGELDAGRFEEALGRGREAADDDPGTAAAYLRRALGEWGGTPFGTIEGIETIDMTRNYLQIRRAELLDKLAKVELAAGRHTRLVADLTTWCAEFPDSESLAASLVIALYRSGDPIRALGTCRAFALRFNDDYGLDAAHEFRRLEGDILTQAKGLDAPSRPVISAPGADAPPGREAVIDRIVGLLGNPYGPWLVPVVGPPGIGVTTILGSVALRIPRALLLDCGPQHSALVLDQLGRRLAVQLDDLPPDGRASVLVDALRKKSVPVIAIDNVGALDADSTEVLSLVGRMPGAPPILTGGRSLRPEDNPLLHNTADLALTVAIPLGPLDAAAAVTVVRSLCSFDSVTGAQVDAIVAAGAGDPFLLTTLTRHVLAGGDLSQTPMTVSEFARRSIASMSDPTRRVLEHGAIDPPSLADPALLARVMEIPVTQIVNALEEGMAAGVLRDQPIGLGFRHSLFVRVLVQQSSDVGSLHAKFGGVLSNTGGVDPARLAAHLRGSSDPAHGSLAVQWTRLEAADLIATGAPLTAADRFGMAAALAESSGLEAGTTLTLQLQQADALTSAGHIVAAQALSARVADRARTANLPETFARAALLAVGPWVPVGPEARRAIDLVEEALDGIDVRNTSVRVELLEAYARATTATTMALNARCGSVETELIAATARSASQDTVTTAHRALREMSWQNRDRPAARAARSHQMVASAIRGARHPLQLEALKVAATDLIECADGSGAREAVDYYRQRAADLHSPLHQWWGLTLAECLMFLDGRSDVLAQLGVESTALTPLIDPDLLLLIERERMLSEAVRLGTVGELAAWLGVLDEPGSATSRSDPLIALAGMAVAAGAGASAPHGHITAAWRQLAGGSRTIGAAALATLALENHDASTVLVTLADLADELGPASSGVVVLSGAAILGPVDHYLGLLHDRLGEPGRAAASRDAAVAVADAFAPPWSDFVRTPTERNRQE